MSYFGVVIAYLPKSQSRVDIHYKTPAATEDHKTKKIDTSKIARHERTVTQLT